MDTDTDTDTNAPPETSELLALYDRHERRGPACPHVRVERTPHTVRHLEPDSGSWIVWSDLAAAADPDAVIAGERERFARAGSAVEWKAYAHDRPADLGVRLRAAGFVPEAPEALLIAPAREVAGDDGDEGGADDGGADDADAAPGVRLFRVAPGDEAALAAYRAVHEAVWPDHAADVTRRLRRLLDADPQVAAGWVAMRDGRPVATGTLIRTPGSPFASLLAGATAPEARGAGLYRRLLRARARHAVALGAPWLAVDAGPMSRPILERLGFRFCGATTPYRFEPGPSGAWTG